MRVSTWHGSGIYGIRVGTANRDFHFDSSWTEIELELEGHFYKFELTQGFWKKCPEIRDSGTSLIKNWLQKYRTLNWPQRQTPKMELIRLSGNKFKLMP